MITSVMTQMAASGASAEKVSSSQTTSIHVKVCFPKQEHSNIYNEHSLSIDLLSMGCLSLKHRSSVNSYIFIYFYNY